MNAFNVTMHLALFFQVFVAGLALLWGAIVAVTSVPVTSTDTDQSPHRYDGNLDKVSKRKPEFGRGFFKDDGKHRETVVTNVDTNVPSKFKKKAGGLIKKKKPKMLIWTRPRDSIVPAVPEPLKENKKIAPWPQEFIEAMELARLRDEVLRKKQSEDLRPFKNLEATRTKTMEAMELDLLRDEILRKNQKKGEELGPFGAVEAMELARLRDEILRKEQIGELRPFEYLEALRPKAPHQATKSGFDQLSLFDYLFALFKPISTPPPPPPVPEEEEGPIYIDESLVEAENNYYDASEQEIREHLEAGAVEESLEETSQAGDEHEISASSTEGHVHSEPDESSQEVAGESSHEKPEESSNKETSEDSTSTVPTVVKEDLVSMSKSVGNFFRQTNVVADAVANVANAVVTDVATNVANVVTGAVANAASVVPANVVTDAVANVIPSNVVTDVVANVVNAVPTDVVTNVVTSVANVVPSNVVAAVVANVVARTESDDSESKKPGLGVNVFRQTVDVADVVTNVANVADVVTGLATNVTNVVTDTVKNLANVATNVIPSKSGSDGENSTSSRLGDSSFRQTVDVAEVVGNVANVADVVTDLTANVANVVTDTVTNLGNVVTNVIPAKAGSDDDSSEDSKNAGHEDDSLRQTNVAADVAANVTTPVANVGVGVDLDEAVSLKSTDNLTNGLSSKFGEKQDGQLISHESDSLKTSVKSISLKSSLTGQTDHQTGAVANKKKTSNIDAESVNSYDTNPPTYPENSKKVEESLALLKRVVNGNAIFSKGEMPKDVKARLDSLGLPEGSAFGLLGNFFDPVTIFNVLFRGMSKNWSQLVEAALSSPEFVEKLNAVKKDGKKGVEQSDSRKREIMHDESELNLKYYDSIENAMKEVGREIDSKKASNSIVDHSKGKLPSKTKSGDSKTSSSILQVTKTGSKPDVPETSLESTTSPTDASTTPSSESTLKSESSYKKPTVKVTTDKSTVSVSSSNPESKIPKVNKDTTTLSISSTATSQKDQEQRNKKTSSIKKNPAKSPSLVDYKKKTIDARTEELSISPQLPTFWFKH